MAWESDNLVFFLGTRFVNNFRPLFSLLHFLFSILLYQLVSTLLFPFYQNAGRRTLSSRYAQDMLFTRVFGSPILPIAGLPTQTTLSSNPDLAFNQDNGSIHLQRNRSERKRLQGSYRRFVLYDSSHAENTRKILTSGSSTKLTKVAARFSSIHGYSSSFLVSWTTNSVTTW